MQVDVGIAGWSYDDWRGRVYPSSCRDTLEFCARFVPLLEINSTFYRTPSPATVASWAQRTAEHGTVFCAKVDRELTHGDGPRPALVDGVRRALEPLRACGRLQALLAQFPFSFVADDRAWTRIERLAVALADIAPVVVEVRHASWMQPRALDRLRAIGVGVAALDMPIGRGAFALDVPDVLGPAGIAYFRLHGRRSDAWFDPAAGRDQKYDWLYDAGEVDEVWRRLERIAAAARRTLVVANNHFQGKAFKLAVELLARARGAPVPAPDLLRATYPDLVGCTAPAPCGSRQQPLFGDGDSGSRGGGATPGVSR